MRCSSTTLFVGASRDRLPVWARSLDRMAAGLDVVIVAAGGMDDALFAALDSVDGPVAVYPGPSRHWSVHALDKLERSGRVARLLSDRLPAELEDEPRHWIRRRMSRRCHWVPSWLSPSLSTPSGPSATRWLALVEKDWSPPDPSLPVDVLFERMDVRRVDPLLPEEDVVLLAAEVARSSGVLVCHLEPAFGEWLARLAVLAGRPWSVFGRSFEATRCLFLGCSTGDAEMISAACDFASIGKGLAPLFRKPVGRIFCKPGPIVRDSCPGFADFEVNWDDLGRLRSWEAALVAIESGVPDAPGQLLPDAACLRRILGMERTPKWLALFRRWALAVPDWLSRCLAAAGAESNLRGAMGVGLFHGVCGGCSNGWRREMVEQGAGLLEEVAATSSSLRESCAEAYASLGMLDRVSLDLSDAARERVASSALHANLDMARRACSSGEAEDFLEMIRALLPVPDDRSDLGWLLEGMIEVFVADEAAVEAISTRLAERPGGSLRVSALSLHAYICRQLGIAERCAKRADLRTDGSVIGRLAVHAARCAAGITEGSAAMLWDLHRESPETFLNTDGSDVRWFLAALVYQALGDEKGWSEFCDRAAVGHPDASAQIAALTANRCGTDCAAGLPRFILPSIERMLRQRLC